MQAVHLPPLSPDLQSPYIPQVDGQEEFGEHEWWCYCCEYAKLFPTEELLQQHHDEPDHFVAYEESVTPGMCGREYQAIV